MPAFIKTFNSITVSFDDGDTSTVYASERHFDDVCEAVRNEDWDNVYLMTRPAVMFAEKYSSIHVSIEEGVVLLHGEQMHGTLVDRMVEMHKDGFNMDPLANFMVRLNKNPSKRAVDELYGFLEASNLPITSDGHFLAYKRVRDDYMDIWSGKLDNSVGQVVEMQRNKVNDNKEQTCSTGLHFCARSYLAMYGTRSGSATMVVKIDPADVVSIPVDYDNAKGRCCKYVVVEELVHSAEEELELNPVDTRWDEGWDDPEFEDEESVENFVPDVDSDPEPSEVPLIRQTDVTFTSRERARYFVRMNQSTYKFFDRGTDADQRWVARRI